MSNSISNRQFHLWAVLKFLYTFPKLATENVVCIHYENNPVTFYFTKRTLCWPLRVLNVCTYTKCVFFMLVSMCVLPTHPFSPNPNFDCSVHLHRTDSEATCTRLHFGYYTPHQSLKFCGVSLRIFPLTLRSFNNISNACVCLLILG